MSRAERRTRARVKQRAEARAAMSRHTPGRLARDPGMLAANPNRGKRDASPLNWTPRSTNDREQPDAALVVSHPMRTPTGRVARKGGAVEYSTYVMASNKPMPIVKTS